MGFFVGIVFSGGALWLWCLEPLGFKGGGGLSPEWDALSQDGLPDEAPSPGSKGLERRSYPFICLLSIF